MSLEALHSARIVVLVLLALFAAGMLAFAVFAAAGKGKPRNAR